MRPNETYWYLHPDYKVAMCAQWTGSALDLARKAAGNACKTAWEARLYRLPSESELSRTPVDYVDPSPPVRWSRYVRVMPAGFSRAVRAIVRGRKLRRRTHD